MSLGRYLRKRLRKELGRDEKTPEDLMFQLSKEKYLNIHTQAKKLRKEATEYERELTLQKALNVESKFKTYIKKGIL